MKYLIFLSILFLNLLGYSSSAQALDERTRPPFWQSTGIVFRQIKYSTDETRIPEGIHLEGPHNGWYIIDERSLNTVPVTYVCVGSNGRPIFSNRSDAIVYESSEQCIQIRRHIDPKRLIRARKCSDSNSGLFTYIIENGIAFAATSYSHPVVPPPYGMSCGDWVWMQSHELEAQNRIFAEDARMRTFRAGGPWSAAAAQATAWGTQRRR
mgnify:CR=1 FL=1